MKRLILSLMVVLITILNANTPEFDGVYVQTKDNNFVELLSHSKNGNWEDTGERYLKYWSPVSKTESGFNINKFPIKNFKYFVSKGGDIGEIYIAEVQGKNNGYYWLVQTKKYGMKAKRSGDKLMKPNIKIGITYLLKNRFGSFIIKFFGDNQNEAPKLKKTQAKKNENNLKKADILDKEKKYKEAFKLYLPYAKKNNYHAIDKIVDYYFKGKGVKKDRSEATKWYQIAVKHPKADYWAFRQLSLAYFGNRGVKKDLDKALVLMKKANKLAKKWSKSAEKDTRNLIGTIQGLIKDQNGMDNLTKADKAFKNDNFKEAIRLYLPYAKSGNKDAQSKLAELYTGKKARQQGVSDYKKAMYWLKQVAKDGDWYSEYMIGINTKLGVGTEKNLEEAKKWFKLSLKHAKTSTQTELTQKELSKLR